jgi:hypothetical protein
VPKTAVVDHEITRAVGIEVAKTLSQRFGGLYLHVPMWLGKRARIVALREQGLKWEEIAVALLVTQRTVAKVLAEYRTTGTVWRTALDG